MKINTYKNIYATQKSGSNELFFILDDIRTTNKKKSKLERLGYVYATTSSLGRKHNDIIGFNGLLFIDIDDCKDHQKVKEVFEKLPYTVATWYSSSGKNVHALIQVPICKNVDEFKLRFQAFSEWITPYINHLAKLDKITCNPTQLAFESYDPTIFINKDVEVFEGIASPQKQKEIIHTNINIKPTNAREKWVICWFKNEIQSITTNGYPQVLSLAFTLGMHCGGGYIEPTTAEQLISECIGSNEYLNSTNSSGSIGTYLKAGRSAFYKGITKPTIWS